MLRRIIRFIGMFSVIAGFSAADSENLLIPMLTLLLGAALLLIAYGLEKIEEVSNNDKTDSERQRSQMARNEGNAYDTRGGYGARDHGSAA